MDNMNEAVKGEGTQLLTKEQWHKLVASQVNTTGLDDVFRHGWADFSSTQKIAIGQMQEKLNSLEIRIKGFQSISERQEGRLEELQRMNGELLTKMLKAVDLTGRL